MSQENVELLRSLYADCAEGNFWTMYEYVDPEFEFEWKWALAEIGAGPVGADGGEPHPESSDVRRELCGAPPWARLPPGGSVSGVAVPRI